jgi:Cu-processing system ATP-binding protein
MLATDLNIEHLSKRFGRTVALNDVSLALTCGQVVALIGPNGSGKTTLIKCILGLAFPDSGAVLWQGQSTAGQWQYRSAVGYMPQISRYPENLSVAQLFEMMKDIRRSTHTGQYDETLLHDLGLQASMHKKLGTLSGGTRQKVGAALAFLFAPKLLVLDEPSAGLDPLSNQVLYDKIRWAKTRGALVIVTSHLMAEVEALADRVVYLAEGSLRFDKTLAEIQTQAGDHNLSRGIARLLTPQQAKAHA